MSAGKVYHWKHGWIPVSPDAKALVARQNAARAAKANLRAMDTRQVLPEPPEPPQRAPRAPKLPEAKPLFMAAYDSLPPKLQAKMVAKLEEITDLDEAELAKRVQVNLIQMYEGGNKTDVDWYARMGTDLDERARAISDEYGVKLSQEQLVGMVSATSALKRWQENVPFAEAIARKLAADEPFEVKQEDIDSFNAWVTKRPGKKETVDLTPGTYRPSELPVMFAASKTPGMPKAINANAVINAAKIFRGESSVDEIVRGPKQRSFVNNLMHPDNPDYVTNDTWHYRAMLNGIPLNREIGPKGARKTFSYTLQQWADMDLAVADGRADWQGYDHSLDRYDDKNRKAAADALVEPQDFFQAGPASKADNWKSNYGVYPWFVKQTQIAAQQINVSPNAIQAVAWYTIGGGA